LNDVCKFARYDQEISSVRNTLPVIFSINDFQRNAMRLVENKQRVSLELKRRQEREFY